MDVKYARYVVEFVRDVEGDLAVPGAPGNHDFTDDAVGIKQLTAEIQEAFDAGYMAGHFRVIARTMHTVYPFD